MEWTWGPILSVSVCTFAEVDQDLIATVGQALFSAMGLMGVSEFDDIDDADEGDILDGIVRPSGNVATELALEEAAADKAALEITEHKEEGTWVFCSVLLPPRPPPTDFEQVSSIEASGDSALPPEV